MARVASTDQKGLCIILAGNAIKLNGEGQRDAETLQKLIDHLQAYKEGKPYPPPSAPAPSCCYYPHYDDPKRPNFGPTQVRCLHQLYPGLRLRDHHSRNTYGRPLTVLSYPYQDKGGSWWIKTNNDNCKNGRSLQDSNVMPYPNSGGHWNESNWFSFEDPPKHCHHHPCCYH